MSSGERKGNMGLGDENGIDGHRADAGSESEDAGSGVGFSGPLDGPLGAKKASNKRSARFKDEQTCVEITLDVRDDSVAIQNIRSQDQDAALLAKALERRSPSIGIASKLREVSQELRRMASFSSKKPAAGIDRTKSGAVRGLKGLQFVTKNVGTDGGWPEIERRFDELAVDGVLLRTRFGQCIGEQPHLSKRWHALFHRSSMIPWKPILSFCRKG